MPPLIENTSSFKRANVANNESGYLYFSVDVTRTNDHLNPAEKYQSKNRRLTPAQSHGINSNPFITLTSRKH